MPNYFFNMNIKIQPTPICSNGYPTNKFPDDGTTTTLTKSNIQSDSSFTNSDIIYNINHIKKHLHPIIFKIICCC